MEIQEQKLIECLKFIQKSTSKLLNNGCHRDDLKIMMPVYFKEFIRIYSQQTLRAGLEIKTSNLYGCEIVNHYKNEIVVYNEMWNPLKPNTAKILEL